MAAEVEPEPSSVGKEERRREHFGMGEEVVAGPTSLEPTLLAGKLHVLVSALSINFCQVTENVAVLRTSFI